MRNCKQLYIVFFFLFTLVVPAQICQAIPAQFGDSGLISQPTAETLNSGNICVGFIGNCSDNNGTSATILPVYMTLGLGSFLEAYGSYPNVLFTEKEEASGRGFSNVGFKIRLLGKRSSHFKLGIDGQLRRTVSRNINYDGLTDQVYRGIASYNNGTFGLHANVGYIKPESPQYIPYDNQLIYGGGLEYLPNSRLRLLTEIGIETSKSQGLSDRVEATAGFQYFFTPHLTLNFALAKGFADESPDWRALFGFSSCQGIGTYQRPIPRKVAPQVEAPVEAKVETKALKVRTLTPLASKKKIDDLGKVSNKYEISIGEQAEVVTLSPVLPASDSNNAAMSSRAVRAGAAATPLAISSGIPLLQVAPEMAGSIAATALALPVNESRSQQRPSRSYKLNEIVKTDENQSVGKKNIDDPRYVAYFYSIVETPENFTAVFFHKFDQPLDVWVEGAGKSSAQLSRSKAFPYEEITLIVDKVNGKVPYFKLHLGEFSEVFEFFPLRKSVKLGKVEIHVKPALSALAPGTETPDSKSPDVPDSAASPAAAAMGTSEPIPVRSAAKPVQAVANKRFRLPSTVIFAFDDATLTEEGKAAISEVVTTITTEKRWYVLRVDGFTDSQGSEDYNLQLGLRRAISVASYMVTNNGVDPSILFVRSSGENEPIETNETEEGRSLNRRAEIVLFVQKEE